MIVRIVIDLTEMSLICSVFVDLLEAVVDDSRL